MKIRTFTSIQAMRGVAAIMVLIEHGLAEKLGMGVDHLTFYVMDFASTGVDIFFVISGFIVSIGITRNSTFQTSQTRSALALKFAIKRIVRIYPLYWTVLISAVIASHFVDTGPNIPHTVSVVSYILLITPANYFIPQAWTMSFEVYFYAVVTMILFIAPRRAFPMTLLWMLITALVSLYNGYLASVVSHPLVLEFGFGCLVAYLMEKGVRRFALASLPVAFSLLYVNAFLQAEHGPTSGWTRVSTAGIGSAFLIYSFAVLETRGIKFPRILQYLGDASYSIYLWHWLIFAILVAASQKIGLIDGTPLAERPLIPASWIAIAMLFAVGSYEYVEKPVQALLRRHAARAVDRLASA